MRDNGFEDFFRFATEIADGHHWELLGDDGWDDFEQRLAETVGRLPVRRRQAVMMLLFALLEGFADPAEVRTWIAGHDLGSDDDLELFIIWLRMRRPPPEPSGAGDEPAGQGGPITPG